MPVTDFVADDLFIIRVLKHHQSNPDRKWANSYEFRALGVGVEGALLTLANILVLFEAGIHSDLVTFDRVLISTWEEDSVPYDPTSFISSPLTAVGAVPSEGNELAAINVCLDVRRFASTGRYGHLFYRAALVEGEIHAPAGRYTLVSPTTMQTRLTDSINDSGLIDYIGPSATDLAMCMVNKDGTQVRNLLQLKVGGVATVSTDHKWFNRTTT